MPDRRESTKAVRTHLPCPDCGSSDALAEYADGGTYCFSCSKATGGESQGHSAGADASPRPDHDSDVRLKGQVEAIPARKLTAATCEFWDYRVRGPYQYAAYYDHKRRLCGVKRRDTRDKSRMPWRGTYSKKAPLWGQHLWSNKRGKYVVITEGEIDAMSVSQAYANEWPVVSLPGGADTAREAIADALQWLEPFEKVILWFDGDEQGQAAVDIAATILPPGKAYVVKSTFKDANAALVDGDGSVIRKAVTAAEKYTPPGLILATDYIDEFGLEAPQIGLPWSKDFLTAWTYGRRHGELYTFGAGTGIGKSDYLLEEMAYTALTTDEPVAIFTFESGPRMTTLQFCGKLIEARIHKPGTDPSLIAKGVAKLREQCAPLYINDRRGSSDWDEVKSLTRYYAHSHGVKHVVIDNLTMLSEAGQDERGSIEKITKELSDLVEELNICGYLVCHLATPENGSHEEGARVTIRQFKGSRSIGFHSNFMFGLERDQQGDNKDIPDGVTVFRCLKDRFTGEATGNVQNLEYDTTKGIFKVSNAFDKIDFGDDDEQPENGDF